MPAAIFLPDRSPRALTAVRESCSACMRNACMPRSSPSHDSQHPLRTNTPTLWPFARNCKSQISTSTRQPHGPHFPDATPCADRRHGKHDHVTDLLRSGSIVVLNMCTMRVRRVELWTMHHSHRIFSFCFTHRRRQALFCLQHSSTLEPAQPLFVCGSQRLLYSVS